MGDFFYNSEHTDHSDMPQDGSIFEDHNLDNLQFNYDEIQLPWDTNITATDATAGTPETDTMYWQPQTTGFTCAVMAQRGIIEAFTGESVSEAQLVYEATVNGWLTDSGMSPWEVGKLMEIHGISCHVQGSATIEDLMSELAQGHKVIVGVDSGELWNQDPFFEDFFQQAADHAIWVTGVDMSDPAHPKVIINDSGDPDGAGKAYDLSQFLDAWQDSGFHYVATDYAPPDYVQIANGFDPATGMFSNMVSYLSSIHNDFKIPEHVEAMQSIEKLSESPIGSMTDAEQDQLFKSI
jgi:hypothetical protein